MPSSYISSLVGSAMATASPPHTVISVFTAVPMPRTRIENLPQPNELTDWITYVAGSHTSHMPGSNFLHLIVFIVGTRFQNLARDRLMVGSIHRAHSSPFLAPISQFDRFP